MEEYFKTYNAKNVKEKNNKLEKLTGFNASIYGSIVIPYNDSKRHEWKFRVDRGYESVVVGIDEADEKWVNKGFFWQKESINYAYHSNGNIFKSGVSSSLPYGSHYSKISTIIMTLNMGNKILSFKKGDSDKVIKEIPVKYSRHGYKMCVFLNGKWQTVELLSYACFSTDDEKSSKDTTKQQQQQQRQVQNNNNIQQQQPPQPQQQQVQMQNTVSLNDIIIEKVTKISKLETENSSLTMSNVRLKEEIKALKSTISTLQRHNQNMQSQVKQIENEKNQLKKDNGHLLDEQKELQMTIQDLNQKIKQYKLKNIDTTKYLEWGYEQILEWIMSLENGRYVKYKDLLQETLRDEEVKGIHLKKVDTVDVRGWGVKKFDDKKDLTQSIQKLVQQNTNQHIGLNEGAPTAYI